MKTIIRIILTVIIAAVMLLMIESCESVCEDEIRYNGMQKEVASIEQEISKLEEAILFVDIKEDASEFLFLQDELLNLYIDKAFLEIDMEVLRQQSRCF